MKPPDIIQVFKPTPFIVVLFILVVLFQVLVFASFSMTFSLHGDHSDKPQTSYEIARIVTITSIDGLTTCHINWFALAGNLVCSYIIAAIMAWALICITEIRRPALVFGIVSLTVIMLSFCLAIGISKRYWGYCLARPKVLTEIYSVESVTSVIPVRTETDGEGTRKIIAYEDYSISSRLAHAKKDPYYCLSERLLLALDERGLLPSSHQTDLSGLPVLFPLIEDTGILAPPAEGYNDSDLLQGIVIDAMDPFGERTVFLGLIGFQLSNDHYPYYEMLFTGAMGSKELSYIRGQRFFFDSAGIEGFDWYLIWLFLAFSGIVIGFVAIIALTAVFSLVKQFGTKAEGAEGFDGRSESI